MDILLELVLIVWPLAGYFFKAFGLYSIAERRRINHPWISWVPVINAWMLGCISDQYRYVTRGETVHRRMWLLVLPVLKIIAFGAAAVVGIFCILLDAQAGGALSTSFWFLAVLFLAVWLAQYVLEQMAAYDLFCSSNPETAALFLILSILIPCLRPVFIFVDREKELGMPPRQTAVH